MSKDIDERLVQALLDMREAYPEWRLGQLVTNVATWARGVGENAVWNMDDEEFIDEIRRHLSRRASSPRSVR